MSLECCNNDCPCPVPPNTGAYWEKNYDDECCACKADVVGCAQLTDGAEPHRVETPNTCDCECDPTKIQTTDPNPDVCTDGRCEKCCKLAEDNTDENGVFTDPCTPPFKFFRGDCECGCDGNFDCAAVDPSKPDLKTDPEDPSVCECFCLHSDSDPLIDCDSYTSGKEPDLDPLTCECYCALERELELGNNPCTDPAFPDLLPNKCECGCLLDPITCSQLDPSLQFDADTCSCVCKKTGADCSGSTPDFDPDRCECYCIHQTEGNECPRNKPSLTQDCECVCAVVDSMCSAGQSVNYDICECECDNDSSSCTEALPDFDPVLCECYCALAEQQANYEAANGRPASPACDDGYVLDAATCSCIEEYDAESLNIDLIP